jgi:alpha-methylacyl-CoA racemase
MDTASCFGDEGAENEDLTRTNAAPIRATSGPLGGVSVLDLSALGPGPFASMLLADFGADVVHILRPDAAGPDPSVFLRRGKREIVVDLRQDAGPEVVARMADRSDVLLESNRPGAMERRGLGPDILLGRNPRLVYARLTGWGQNGPYANRAGHDINYLAVSGALGAIGTSEPVPPLALLGDLASGSLQAVFGIVLALFERERTGLGQVVDAAIVDGAALLLSAAFGERASGMWPGGRGTHLLSGTAPFYGVYECADGGWFSVGAIEPQFYAAFLEVVAPDEPPGEQWDRNRWPAQRARLADAFRSRTRDDWTAAFATVDACAEPVLDVDELDCHPHLRGRGTVRRDGDRLHSGVAPRLSGHDPSPPAEPGATEPAALLADFGFSAAESGDLLAAGAVAAAPSRG